MNTIPVRVVFSGGNILSNSELYVETASILNDKLEIPFELVMGKPPKDSLGDELVVAIQALAVTVNALGLIWAIIFTRYRCSVAIEIMFEDGSKMRIEKKALTEKRLEKEVEKLEEEIRKKSLEKKIKEIVYFPEN